jgi:16S rRNA (uracil1498-N3)-methyltransferase
MSRRRFFVDRVAGGRAELLGDEARHLAETLRAEPGQRYEISDNRRVWLAEIAEARRGRVEFTVLEEIAEPPETLDLTLLVALMKFDRFEWVVEKGTELGVARFVPVVAVRSEKGLAQGARKRLDRWQRVARSASQQSRRARLPEIAAPVAFSDALAVRADGRWFLDEDERDALLHGPASGGSIALMTGPEGGWTVEERARAVAAGWTPVSLGRRILRTETAAVAAIAVLSVGR